MARTEDLRKGMAVYSADGYRLGRVLAIGHSQFQVQRGLLFPRHFLVDVAEVEEVRRRRLLLRQKRDEVRGVAGGFSDKGYSDRGLAGDVLAGPAIGVGSGLAPALLCPTGKTAPGLPERPAIGRASVVGMTGDVPHPERGAPQAPALGPAGVEPAWERPVRIVGGTAHGRVAPSSKPAPACEARSPAEPRQRIVELNVDEEYERLVTPDPHVNPVP